MRNKKYILFNDGMQNENLGTTVKRGFLGRQQTHNIFVIKLVLSEIGNKKQRYQGAAVRHTL